MTEKLSGNGIWFLIGLLLMGCGWIMPNHYLPWTTFHSDAWVSLCLIIAGFGAYKKFNSKVNWHGTEVFSLLAMVLVCSQFIFGQLLWFGTAWVGVAYILGFLILALVGSACEDLSPLLSADVLFLSIGAASILSVGAQLYQWLNLDFLDLWILQYSGNRPYANLGQPNELSTLLLWGLLGVIWAKLRGYIKLSVLTFASMYILLGIALTRSRTAWIGLVILFCAFWVWRKYLNDKRLPLIFSVLMCYFATCLLSMDYVLNSAYLSDASVDLLRLQSELRPQLWSMFAQALAKEPIWGYGWNQISAAHLQNSLDSPPFGSLAAHSHNLFLDFILWFGIPSGLIFSIGVLAWVWKSIVSVKSGEDVVLLLLVAVVLNHAMLELPLHHAYFLFPLALVVGSLNVRLSHKVFLVTNTKVVLVLLAVAASMFFLTVRDYFKVEASYLTLRYEWAHLKVSNGEEPPDLTVLNQFEEFIRYARFEPSPGMSDEELNWMRNVSLTYPNAGVIFKYAKALALNNQGEQAQIWIERVCNVITQPECVLVKNTWERFVLSKEL